MARIELEITDKMMGRLQERAEAYAVEPSDIAKSILAADLAKREKPCWVDKLSIIVSRISDAVIAVSKVEAKESEQNRQS